MTLDARYRSGAAWKRYSRPDITIGGVITAPVAPTNLSSSAITDTTVTLTWTRSVSSGITEQRIYLNNSRYFTVPNGTASSQQITGLTPGTPYTWKITAYNGTTALNSGFSNAYSMSTTSTQPAGAPNAPASFAAVKSTSAPTSSISVTWAAPTVDGSHAAQTGYRIYVNGVKFGSDLGASATSLTVTGLTPGSTYTVTGKAFNASGESASTAGVNVTLDNVVVTTNMMMGCSTSNKDHGGTEVWEGWRTYSKSELYTRCNRTGSLRPKFMAYSENGDPLSGSYASILEHCLDELDEFYYTGSSTSHNGGSPSGRWGIKLFWSNGNENSDRGMLTEPHTTTGINAFVTSMRALYDAVHFIDPGTGQRRYPDAYAGDNPTQNFEINGIVQDYLHPSAQYHDFVMWSFYPPGRQDTEADPTFNWPSFNEADRNNRQLGYLIRCFYRTYQAQLAARNATGDPNFSLMISGGEVGIGDNPNDSTTRPYYAVHALAGGMQKLADQYGLQMPYACWWDNQSNATSPQNILSDEPTSTNPSTRVAWQNWRSYNHQFGGTHPASWAGNPKSSWKTTGPVV